ncbi:MAG: HupE/UreJ family protein [Steroidobacteraceae bacterium]
MSANFNVVFLGGPGARRWWVWSALLACLSLCVGDSWAHGVTEGDAGYLQNVQGVAFIPYLYLGAKHMVTGYDHLLFLAGVIFFLYRLKDVALYVTLFAIGHSTTLLLGVLAGIHANAYVVDAIIGLSVVYKAFENIGGFQRLGIRIDTRAAVLLFGLAHGFGLSTKLQELTLSRQGLVANMIGFNIGVELGQFAALALILLAFNLWRRSEGFLRSAYVANVIIMAAGFVLFGYQLTGYLLA